MNHHKDIDDGLEEFQDAQERTDTESRLRRNPSSFNFAHPGFHGEKAEEVLLSGPKTRDAGTPLDFESGYASVIGKLQAADPPYRLQVRWAYNGADTVVNLLPI